MINDGDSETSLSPIFSEGRRVFVHRLHFAHFGLESGMVFEGNMRVYKRSSRFGSK